VEEIHEEIRIAINLVDEQIYATYFAWYPSSEKKDKELVTILLKTILRTIDEILKELIKDANCRRFELDVSSKNQGKF
jgi:hypothetical protein